MNNKGEIILFATQFSFSFMIDKMNTKEEIILAHFSLIFIIDTMNNKGEII